MQRSFAVKAALFILISITTAGSTGCNGDNRDSRKVPQASIEVTIDPDQGSLNGKMTLELKSDKPITLTLGPGFRFSGYNIEHGEVKRLASRGITIHPQRAAYVEIEWRGGPLATQQLSRGHIKEESVHLGQASGWYPQPSPQNFGYELEVTLPAELQVVAEGSRGDDQSSNGKRQVTFHHHPPAAGITLVAGRWQKESRTTEYGKVYTFFPAHLHKLSDRYLEHSAEYIATYGEWIAPPPHDSYSIVAAPLPVGLAFAGFTYIGEEVLRLPFIPATSLPHEVVHNWWGRSVYTDRSDGNWSEPLTQYMGDYYQATQRSAEKAERMRGDWLRDQAALPESRDYSMVNFRNKQSQVDDIVGYQRGAYLFHTLQRRLGEDIFTQAIRRFYSDYRHKWAGWHDLRHTFATVAEQHNHDPDIINDMFFWFLTTTHTPELRLEGWQTHAVNGGYEVEVKLSWDENAYPATIPVIVSSTAKVHKHQISLAPGESKKFSVALDSPPKLLQIDPHHHVYRQLAKGEGVTTLRHIQLAEQVTLVTTQSSEEWLDEIMPSAERAFMGDVSPGSLTSDNEMIIVGSPGEVKEALKESQACALRITPPVAANTVAWSNTSGAGRPLVAVSAASAQEARNALQRLKRYGRHSYVGFNGRPQTGLYEPAEHHALRVQLTAQ